MDAHELATFLREELPKAREAALRHHPSIETRGSRALLSALDAAVELLREAATGFEYLARYGFAFGNISCPQDYNFYIKPMRDSAQRAADTLRLVVGEGDPNAP